MATLIILPTYNEAQSIAEVLDRCREAAPEASVLVVDDNSPDGTATIVEQAAEHSAMVNLMQRPEKAGLGSAYRAGMRWGIEREFSILIEMDSDLSHDPSLIPELESAVKQGASLAIGSRYIIGGSVADWSFFRKLISKTANRLASTILDLRVSDSTSGFRAFDSKIFGSPDFEWPTSDGYGFQVEMAHHVAVAGGTIVEVPIVFTDRVHGTSKFSRRDIREAAQLLLKHAVRRTKRPKR